MYIMRWLFYYLQPAAAAPRKYDIIFTRNKYIIILYIQCVFYFSRITTFCPWKKRNTRSAKGISKKKKKNLSYSTRLPPGLNGDLSLTVGGMKAETDARPG